MTDDRDEELKRLEQELNQPFIERPAELDIGAGMLCWLDGARVCGPDCVAYNTEEFDPATQELVQGPNRCLVLLYMGQQGAAAISTVVLNRKRITGMQDVQRGNAPPPPDPFGKRKP